MGYGPVIICNRKQSHYSDRIEYAKDLNPATSTFLSVVSLPLKSSDTQGMLLRFESTGKYAYAISKQVKVVYYYKVKES
jgi:hypothetical protein